MNSLPQPYAIGVFPPFCTSHSIAVLLCILSGKRESSLLAPQLAQLTQSRYVQTIETFLVHGGTQFLVRSSEGEHDKTINSYLYTPQQCEIDENGYLVRKSDFGIAIGDLAEDLMWEFRAFHGELDEEEEDIYENILKNRSYQKHNPIERHKFSRWLSCRKEGIKERDVLEWLQYVASDPISFVRSTAIEFLSPELVCTNKEFHLVFLSLCYDSHPLVKIDILENFIMLYWHSQQPESREEWKRIVLDMLDDPVVKDRTSMGLINMSEHKTYHEFHSQEQQVEWFCAVAPKLLEDKFNHYVHFENTLDKFEENFLDLPLSFRIGMLYSIVDYVDRLSYETEDTVYIIQNLLMRRDLHSEERNILTELINRLSPWGRAYVALKFAQSYTELEDIRLRSFVQRPFFVETASEFLPERVAILMGFLTNPRITIEDLPDPVRHKTSGDSVEEKVYNYIEEQDDNFKLLTLFTIFGYGHAHHLTISADSLHDSELTTDLVEYFHRNGTVEQAILVADMLQSRGYYKNGVHGSQITFVNTKWYTLFSRFIFHPNTAVAQAVCDLIFHANITESVHNTFHFAELLCLIAQHTDDSVKRHVYTLINEYWFEIMRQLVSPALPNSAKEFVREVWFPLANEILENSVDFKLHGVLSSVVNHGLEVWETYDASQRQQLIDMITTIPRLAPSYSLFKLALKFYRQTRDSLSEDQRTMFSEIQDLHREAFDNQHHKLKEMSPEFDWSFFYHKE